MNDHICTRLVVYYYAYIVATIDMCAEHISAVNSDCILTTSIVTSYLSNHLRRLRAKVL